MGRSSLDLVASKRGGKTCSCEARVKRHRDGEKELSQEAFQDQFWQQVTCNIPCLVSSLHLQHLLLFTPGTLGGSCSERDGHRNGRGCCQVYMGLLAKGKARGEPAQGGLKEKSEEAKLQEGDG